MTRGPERQFDRQEVLGKAMAHFWAHGYENTGLSDLTRAMGIGRQSLYNTFGAQRASKILGAFSRLASVGGKPGYLRHIERAKDVLRRNLSHPVLSALRLWYAPYL